jgi:hypothetical protein
MDETMVGFGPKQAWLAIREGDDARSARTAACEDRSREQMTAAVAAALGLRDLGTVSWRNGIDLAYLTDDRLVFTPLLPGADDARWLLVTGRWLLRNGQVDVAQLSAALGTEVQFFATYRVSELHRWQRAVDGVVMRAFEYVGRTGEVIEWRGEIDDAEAAIGLPAVLDDEADILVSEEDVMRVARAWSVDPTALDGRPAPGPLRAAAV